MNVNISDGGRLAAGYKGQTGDCVVRAIANATGKPYQEVYDAINELAKHERTGKRKKRKSNARDGVWPATTRKYMTSIGWEWHSTMGIGTGCTVHLKADELPQGRLVIALSKHYTAVIDGVIHDIYDPSRNGTRCVYGYYAPKPEENKTKLMKSHLELLYAQERAIIANIEALNVEHNKLHDQITSLEYRIYLQER